LHILLINTKNVFIFAVDNHNQNNFKLHYYEIYPHQITSKATLEHRVLRICKS